MALGAVMSHLPVEEAAVHDVELLLTREPHEVHRITRNANRELRVLVWILHRVEQRLLLQDVEVHMESALAKEHVKASDGASDGCGIALTVVGWDDRQGVANTVLRFRIRQSRD